MKVALAAVLVELVVLAASWTDQVTDASWKLGTFVTGLAAIGWMLRRAVRFMRAAGRAIIVIVGDEATDTPNLSERLERGEKHFAKSDQRLDRIEEDIAGIGSQVAVIAEAERAHIRAALAQQERRKPPSAA